MTQKLRQTSKAMTAIAAALAFTSTPSLAQETAAPDPVTESDPLAPDAADPAPVVTDSADTPPAPQPKVETTRTAAATTTRRAASTAPRSTARRSPAPAAAPPAPAATAATTAQPAEAAPPLAAPPPVEPLPTTVAEPAPASDPVDGTTTDLLADDALPIAGAAALGLLALGGAGLAMRRRKRRREEAEFEARQQFLDRAESEHVEQHVEPLELDRSAEVRPGPAFVRPGPIHDPVPARKAPVAAPIADAPKTDLPAGFDLSRFGPHVQAAYRGPTEDNPSLSLKHRVRRAAAMDQQERREAEERAAGSAAPTLPAKGNWESRTHSDFLFRRADSQPKEPAEQHS